MQVNLKKEKRKADLLIQEENLRSQLTQKKLEIQRLETIIEQLILEPEGKLALSIKEQVFKKKKV
jgi:hypothetical protein